MALRESLNLQDSKAHIEWFVRAKMPFIMCLIRPSLQSLLKDVGLNLCKKQRLRPKSAPQARSTPAASSSFLQPILTESSSDSSYRAHRRTRNSGRAVVSLPFC
eukprot:3730608-Amphidinium_carterae.1